MKMPLQALTIHLNDVNSEQEEEDTSGSYEIPATEERTWSVTLILFVFVTVVLIFIAYALHQYYLMR
jgi:hypothetical protein